MAPRFAPNTLTRNAGLRLGPIFFETLLKHYIEQDAEAVPLRKDELLYDEVFSIVRLFLSQASAKHTVEELQAFSNTRTPATPASHVVRVTIPMATCDAAALHLIAALGGEENTKRTVGGIKWWQVRGVGGVSAEWMCSKQDQQEAKRRAREAAAGRRKPTSRFTLFNPPAVAEERRDSGDAGPSGSSADAEPGDDEQDVYRAEMDNLKCILYFHGGGYYFGSIDQERYTMQRMARKIHGRLLAVNYRLAPQYPFPCAIQDILAAYIYLIRPPEGALHLPVLPENIVIAGDSAGGGLAIALLQVIRDAGLPLPAGGILISPWCDLTHSFPSIYQNTATDVIPATGLSLHKPSSLWPPPPDGVNARVREGLRASVRAAFHRTKHPNTGAGLSQQQAPPDPAANTVALPPVHCENGQGQTVVVDDHAGTQIEIDTQLQLYVPNSLIRHPLVSAALSYLGGLCPLLVIASDREVLRDEGIYTAHRAADPARFPIKQEVRDVHPKFRDLTPENMVPTPVHLQVYDDAAHVLPVLFPFTQPAKYCFRAMAAFCKQVFETDARAQQPSDAGAGVPGIYVSDAPVMASPTSEHFPPLPGTPVLSDSPDTAALERAKSLDAGNGSARPPLRERMSRLSISGSLASLRRRDRSSKSIRAGDAPPSPTQSRSRSRRESSVPPSPRTQQTDDAPPLLPLPPSPAADGDHTFDPTPPLPSFASSSRAKAPSADVAGPRHKRSDAGGPDDVFAGDAAVYARRWPAAPARMIRERVGINGVVRPLEPEAELPAFSVPEARVGVVPEAAIARYLAGKKKMDAKYAHEIRRIARKRARVARDAPAASTAHLARLQHALARNPGENASGEGKREGVAAGVLGANWSLAWALDADEHPPPSSIVARRDTREARALARVADQAVLAEPSRLTANALWSATLQLFTLDESRRAGKEREGEAEGEGGEDGKRRRRKRESVTVVGRAGGEEKKRRAGFGFWRLKLGREKEKETGEKARAGGGVEVG